MYCILHNHIHIFVILKMRLHRSIERGFHALFSKDDIDMR